MLISRKLYEYVGRRPGVYHHGALAPHRLSMLSGFLNHGRIFIDTVPLLSRSFLSKGDHIMVCSPEKLISYASESKASHHDWAQLVLFKDKTYVLHTKVCYNSFRILE